MKKIFDIGLGFMFLVALYVTFSGKSFIDGMDLQFYALMVVIQTTIFMTYLTMYLGNMCKKCLASERKILHLKIALTLIFGAFGILLFSHNIVARWSANVSIAITTFAGSAVIIGALYLVIWTKRKDRKTKSATQQNYLRVVNLK